MNITIADTVDSGQLRDLCSGADKVIVFTDSNVSPIIPNFLDIEELPVIVTPAREEHKDLAALASLWRALQTNGATRSSILINVGGGMVTDLGGFGAATFRRGIQFINISTTLLGSVDASVGGKTGIDFDGLKNQVGAFAEPLHTFILTAALRTLPDSEMLSGYAEMVKTGYIHSPELAGRMLALRDRLRDSTRLNPLILASLETKKSITDRDPHEKGLRKILNFGHTAGHAFEMLRLRAGRPVPHGIAVAHGMLTAIILSHTCLGLPSKEIYRYADFLKSTFPPLRFTCDDYPQLLAAIASDKKNRAGAPARFTLLRAVGEALPDVPVPNDEITAALDIHRDLTE